MLAETITDFHDERCVHILEVEGSDNSTGDGTMLKVCGPSSMTQLLLDIRFISNCFFQRNKYSLPRNVNFLNRVQMNNDDKNDNDNMNIKLNQTNNQSSTSTENRHPQLIINQMRMLLLILLILVLLLMMILMTLKR